MTMTRAKRCEYSSLVILCAINLAIRYPISAHELGWDSFYIHGLANTISNTGHVTWILNPLSIIGYYPYSYATGVPLLLSELSQLSGLAMEWTIWGFCASEGIIASIFAYTMAREINDDKFFKFILALSFSLSPGVLSYTTWTATARGIIIIFTVLVIYILLKMRMNLKMKYLLLMMLILLTTLHNLYIIIIAIVVSYCASLVFHNPISSFLKRNNISDRSIGFLLVIGLMLLVSLPFHVSDICSYYLSYYGFNSLGMSAIITIALTYGYKIGILGFISLSYFLYILFKHNKTQFDFFLIIFFIVFAPMMAAVTYASIGILPLSSILVGLGYLKITGTLTKEKTKNVFILIVLIAICWSTLDQTWNPGLISERGSSKVQYMCDSTIVSAKWLAENLNNDERVFADGETLARRINAVSGIQAIPQQGSYDHIYGLVQGPIKLKLKPFYTWIDDGPFAVLEPKEIRYSYWYPLMNYDCDDPWTTNVISKFNLNYAIDYVKKIKKESPRELPESAFFNSVSDKKNKIYANIDFAIWDLK